MTASRYTSLFGRRGWKALVLLLSLGALHGCGGGGGDDAKANPNGYYGNDGSADVKMADNVNPRPITDLQGMIHDGQFIMLSEAEHLAYHGTIAVNGNSFTGSVTVYQDGVGDATLVPISGSISQGQFIDGRLDGTGAGNGTFRLNYSADNSVVVANADLDIPGPWWVYVRNINFFKIRASDTANQQDANISSADLPLASQFPVLGQCGFLGRIDPVATHLYTVSVTMDSCTNQSVLANPDYHGLATLRTENMATPNDRFVIVLSNGAYSVDGEFRPVP